MILPLDFYRRDDVLAISRELLGKVLVTDIDGATCSAAICETEAYAGVDDRASHAFGGRRTARTEPMFADGGIAYVYLCYGIHHLFNVVSGRAGTPQAILVRAGVPLQGLDTMLLRRGKKNADRSLLGGPGSLARALGITTADSGLDLNGGRISIEDRGIDVAADAVTTGPRVGIDYAGEDARLPYRFRAAFALPATLNQSAR